MKLIASDFDDTFFDYFESLDTELKYNVNKLSIKIKLITKKIN